MHKYYAVILYTAYKKSSLPGVAGRDFSGARGFKRALCGVRLLEGWNRGSYGLGLFKLA